MNAALIYHASPEAGELPLHETAAAWIEQHGLDLDRLTPDDLLAELRVALLDADICKHENEIDYTLAPW